MKMKRIAGVLALVVGISAVTIVSKKLVLGKVENDTEFTLVMICSDPTTPDQLMKKPGLAARYEDLLTKNGESVSISPVGRATFESGKNMARYCEIYAVKKKD